MKAIQPLLKDFLTHAHKQMGFDAPIKINFKSDSENAKNPLGKTAYYEPRGMSITVFTDNRHPKDIMRSISHELVHHSQNCRGDFDDSGEMAAKEGYFQENPHMRELEREAYQTGNMCFRDWEEKYRDSLRESKHYYLGGTIMNTKEWKNRAVFGRLMENFGYGKGSFNEDPEGEVELEEAITDEIVEDEAIEASDGSKSWYLNGKLHREDGPAVEHADGSKSWWLNDKLHREDGPAVEWGDGSKSWYLNGKHHREDGPAIENANGSKMWYINGKQHSEDEWKKEVQKLKDSRSLKEPAFESKSVQKVREMVQEILKKYTIK